MWYDTCQKHLGEHNSTLLWEVNLRSDTSDAETRGRDKRFHYDILCICILQEHELIKWERWKMEIRAWLI